MIVVRLYEHSDDPGESLHENLKQLSEELDFEIKRIDISADPDLENRFSEKVPCIKVGPYTVQEPVELDWLKVTLQAAIERDQLKDNPQAVQFGVADKISYWISRNFIMVVMAFLFVYTGLPILAPVLMKAGLEGLAKPIYSLYSPLCHQFAYRSFFLYGEQSVYPRETAGLDHLHSFEEVSGLDNISNLNAKEFLGNEEMGYKMALCERDMAMYAAMFLFGVVFLATGRKIKAPHILVWVILGIGPIGLDGGTQLISQWFDIPFLPYRESIPLLRVLTGGMFGLFTGWLGFPLLEEGMAETRQAFAEKLSLSDQNGE